MNKREITFYIGWALTALLLAALCVIGYITADNYEMVKNWW